MVATLTIPLEKSLMQIVPLVLPILRNKECGVVGLRRHSGQFGTNVDRTVGQAAQRGHEPQEERLGERDEHHDGQDRCRPGDGCGDGLHVVVSSQNLLARTAMRASTVQSYNKRLK